MLQTTILIVHVFVAMALIGLVLMQKGKGAEDLQITLQGKKVKSFHGKSAATAGITGHQPDIFLQKTVLYPFRQGDIGVQ